MLNHRVSTQNEMDSHLFHGGQLFFSQCIEVDGRMSDRAGTILQDVHPAKQLGLARKMTGELLSAFQDTM